MMGLGLQEKINQGINPLQATAATTAGIEADLISERNENMAKAWQRLAVSDYVVYLAKSSLGTLSRRDYDYEEPTTTKSTISVREDSIEAQLRNGQEQAAEPIIIDVTFSPQIAADLKAKRVRAFVPVSAAELIWLEAQSVDDDSDE
jgi:hypothetical protein